jgi:TatA/E family protein of Tat protein translocase
LKKEIPMFGMGMPEILLILAIALIVLGPKKLPEVAKSLGRGIAEFKKATQEFKDNLEVDNDLKEAKSAVQEMKKDLEDSVRQTVMPTPVVPTVHAASEDKLKSSVAEDSPKDSEASEEEEPVEEAGTEEPLKNA